MSATTTFFNLLKDEQGATAIEYGLIASLIVIAMIGGMTAFGNSAMAMWDRVQTAVSNAR
ncbi:Flp family type IVb pilin [Alteraurantiacibacter aquimixticola]|uniref:Flp family type IVb pilin n=1 Tax=Alteraurantiacibacter aquimixticola TaxID=2489173 RepID=A0A4T3F433_9SPHN|nr:Flp family type IVb pilin [Alteraurantiacibacter aquimixticola]TIX52023.1 Flp family type IVb pilin [Alteraurantiacibacter aquimixticola]